MPTISSITFQNAEVTGGQPVQCTVTLQAAETTGVVISVVANPPLSVDNNQVIIDAHQTETTFTVSTAAVTNDTPATLKATLAGVEKASGELLVKAPISAQRPCVTPNTRKERWWLFAALAACFVWFAWLISAFQNPAVIAEFQFTGPHPYHFLTYRPAFFLWGIITVLLWYVALGRFSLRRGWGVLIDEQNRVSLSQFHTVSRL